MKTKSLLLSLTFVLALAAPAFADDEAMTLKGEILDMACWVAHEAKGADHADCAKKCVKSGQPMGLLTEDGTVYLLYASHKDPSAFKQAMNHAGEQVELTGASAERGGVRGIEVQSVKSM